MFNRCVKNNDQIEKLRKEFKYVVPVSEIQMVLNFKYLQFGFLHCKFFDKWHVSEYDLTKFVVTALF